MTHARTLIRKAFVDALKGKTAAEHRVYDSRLYTMDAATSLPGIIVFSTNEEVITSTISFPRTQERKVRIIVECYIKTTSKVNALEDGLTAEVEELITASDAIWKLCKDCHLESTEISLNNDGDKPIAVASMVFLVMYVTKESK